MSYNYKCVFASGKEHLYKVGERQEKPKSLHNPPPPSPSFQSGAFSLSQQKDFFHIVAQTLREAGDKKNIFQPTTTLLLTCLYFIELADFSQYQGLQIWINSLNSDIEICIDLVKQGQVKLGAIKDGKKSMKQEDFAVSAMSKAQEEFG